MTKTKLSYNARVGTFALRTTDSYGDEHVELFTVPRDAQSFIVAGVDCAALRDMVRRAIRVPVH